LTEKSIREGFEALMGDRCDVFAKMIYIKLSNSIDHKKLTLVEFYNLFKPIMVRN